MDIIASHGLKYEIIPYFISGHPGCTDADMRELAQEVRSLGIRPEQVQDFTPTPMTVSTLLYYTGFDPVQWKKGLYSQESRGKKTSERVLLLVQKKSRD